MTPKQKAALDIIAAAHEGTTVRRVALALGISPAAATERIRPLRRAGLVATTHKEGGQAARLCLPERAAALRAQHDREKAARAERHDRNRRQREAMYAARRPVWQRTPASVWHYASQVGGGA